MKSPKCSDPVLFFFLSQRFLKPFLPTSGSVSLHRLDVQCLHPYSTMSSLNSRNHTVVLTERFREFLANTNYQIYQTNGQRIYAPCASSGIRPPPKGTEIFIGNLPPDLFEDEIVPLFSQKGAIYNVRLMMDFFGRNRGYGFVSYFRPEDAHAAVAAFNKFKIRNRSKIAVCISVDNRRLFIGNIPRNVTLSEIWGVLDKYVEGIVEVILYREPFNENINRGFVFVEFETHRLAAMARRQLSPGNLIVWGRPIYVDWAEPLPIISPEIMKQVST